MLTLGPDIPLNPPISENTYLRLSVVLSVLPGIQALGGEYPAGLLPLSESPVEQTEDYLDIEPSRIPLWFVLTLPLWGLGLPLLALASLRYGPPIAYCGSVMRLLTSG